MRRRSFLSLFALPLAAPFSGGKAKPVSGRRRTMLVVDEFANFRGQKLVCKPLPQEPAWRPVDQFPALGGEHGDPRFFSSLRFSDFVHGVVFSQASTAKIVLGPVRLSGQPDGYQIPIGYKFGSSVDWHYVWGHVYVSVAETFLDRHHFVQELRRRTRIALKTIHDEEIQKCRR